MATLVGGGSLVTDYLGWIIGELVKKRPSLSENDQKRLRRRWGLWLKNKTFGDLEENVFHRRTLSTFIDFPYTAKYQIEKNQGGIFACVDQDQLNPLNSRYRKYSSAPLENSCGELTIYDSSKPRMKIDHGAMVSIIKQAMEYRGLSAK
jgi:hypothetical protein